MGWEDRDYSRESRRPLASSILMWLWSGSVKLFTFAGIRVYLHSSFVVYAILVLLIGIAPGVRYQVSVEAILILYLIVLVHEFGHCFAARWVGGDAEEIMMTPLGGLAFANPPHRPLPTFITVAAGPAVNVVICLICSLALWAMVHWEHVAILPAMFHFTGWLNLPFHVSWIFATSLTLLLFNLLPIFPLDGGQMLQAILWPKFGYYKSMLFSCVTGMIGAVVMGMISIATHQFLMVLLWASLFFYCYSAAP